MGTISVKIIVRGLVQGVFFRATMSEIARQYNVNGWVRNRPDGSVEALLEGDEEDVNKVIEWARHGPKNARVDSISIHKQDQVHGYRGFRIIG